MVVLASSSQPGGTAGARISRPALGALISAAIAILVAALLQANSVAIGSFLDDSSELAQTEAALVATQLSLRTLSQAVVLAEDVELGVADRETAETAAAEAARVTTDLENRLRQADAHDEHGRLFPGLNALCAAAEILRHEALPLVPRAEMPEQ